MPYIYNTAVHERRVWNTKDRCEDRDWDRDWDCLFSSRLGCEKPKILPFFRAIFFKNGSALLFPEAISSAATELIHQLIIWISPPQQVNTQIHHEWQRRLSKNWERCRLFAPIILVVYWGSKGGRMKPTETPSSPVRECVWYVIKGGQRPRRHDKALECCLLCSGGLSEINSACLLCPAAYDHSSATWSMKNTAAHQNEVSYNLVWYHKKSMEKIHRTSNYENKDKGDSKRVVSRRR